MITEKRYDFVDTAKGIAIFLVVMGHVLACCKSSFMKSWDDMIVWRFIYSFHMPLFMFVSGFVCFNPRKKYNIRDILKRFASYLIPFFTVTLLLGVFKEKIDYNMLWYFRTLAEFCFFLYIGNVVIEKCRINHSTKVIFTVIIFLVEIFIVKLLCQRFLFINTIIDSSHISLYVFFITGYIIRYYFPLIEKFLINDYSLALSFILIVLLYNIFPLSTTLKQFVVVFFVLNLSALKPLGSGATLQNLGKNTQSVYILHFFILFNAPFVGDFFSNYSSMAMIWQAIPQLIWSVPVTIISIKLCLYVSTIIKSSPLLSLLILGDTKIIQTKIKVK